MRRILVVASLLFANLALAQTIPIDDAAQVFQTAKRVSDRDGGKLWGMPVCGPMLLVDRASHFMVANQADALGKLKQIGGVWTGELPAEINPANTAMEWAGVRWTMLLWPVTSDTRDRERLLAHECFHRIQPALKLSPKEMVNSHLDGKDGRIWIQLEWRALERALATSASARRHAIRDALIFRRYRRELLKSAAERENLLECNEGISEYTGVTLANANEADRRATAISALHSGSNKRSFGRSFAYVSGPAYGILLDAIGTPWRKALTPDSDLGALLAVAYKIELPKSLDAQIATAASASYGGETLIVAETARARELEAKLATLRRRFVDGPVLLLPARREFSYAFDPNDIVSLDDNNAVYGSARITDEWGTLEAESGALIGRDNGNIVRVAVSAPPDTNTLVTDGWRLTLKPGWSLAAGPRTGDFAIKMAETSSTTKSRP